MTRRVEAGAPLRIYAATDFSRTTGVTGMGQEGFSVHVARNQCLAEAVFTPEAGRAYRVVQREQRVGVCELEIVDTTTNAAPEGVQVTNETGCFEGERFGGGSPSEAK
ncbi:MAG TPA: hypothetical protein VM915_03700 [Verrucomicrobiae bacterium]|nr:hypothetical protein [Verrucomicrobiae bacterium]